jgi:CheY-like chemotaxis protein
MHTILVVDDLEGNVKLLTRWLSAKGFGVMSVRDGEAAVAAAQQHQPDLVLLDLMMPPPNGFDVCERLKQDARTRHIPVIVTTGLHHPANLMRARQLGAADVLLKPLDEAPLIAAVERALGGRGPHPARGDA